MSSAPRPPRRIGKLLLVAFITALPFFGGAYYLQEQARLIDTLPLDKYWGLRWMPEEKGLCFLHRPLRQDPPPSTELYSYSGSGDQFPKLEELPSEYGWTLTKGHSDTWLLLEARKSEAEPRMAYSNGKDLKYGKMEPGWTHLPSVGNGVFIQTEEDDLPFDQFVDVEAAPDIKPELDELPRDQEELIEEEAPAKPPTHLGLKISRYDVDKETLDPVLVVPYNRAEEKPIIQMVSPSPDKRFLALVVQFGQSGSPGLWVYDSKNARLLWTRALVEGKCQGLDWSSDSVRVAVSDDKGLIILEAALGIESTRLELSSTSGLKPRWGAGYKLYLVSDQAVYQVEMDRGKAVPLFNLSSQKGDPRELVLDPLGGRVAFTVSPEGYPELVMWDLKTKRATNQVALPGSQKLKAQGTVVYQLGSAIRYAWLLWTGGV